MVYTKVYVGSTGIALGAYGAHGLAKVVGDDPIKIKVYIQLQ